MEHAERKQSSVPRPVDLLAEAVARIKSRLDDPALSARQRLQVLWAGAVAARGFATRHVWGDELAKLVVETGLLRSLPWRTSAVDVCHVLRWAWLGRNPWR